MFRQLSFIQNLIGSDKKRSDPAAEALEGASQATGLKGRDEVLHFAGREVTVRRKPYKRAIGVTLQVNGKIKVSAPKSAPLRKIHDFLLQNAQWIETHSSKYAELRQSYPRKQYTDGETFLFLGERRPLRFSPGDGRKAAFRFDEGALVCTVPSSSWNDFDPHAPHPELVMPLLRFYESRARELLAQRIELYSNRMHLYPSAVIYRSQKTRWGSCSSQGRVSLNWRLVIAPLDVIDYVVVHELAHLRYYNHSKAFWSLVATQIPDYERLRRWLRKNQYEADFLARQSELHPE